MSLMEMDLNSLDPTFFNGTDMKDQYSYEHDYDPTDGEDVVQLVVVLCVCITVSLVGIVGNGMVLWNLIFRIPKTHFTIYILNLALADFLFLVIFLFAVLFTALYELDIISEDDTSDIFVELSLFGYVTSQYLLTAISFERCLSIRFPIWYRCDRPRYLSHIVCAALWTLSSLMLIARFVFCNDEHGCKALYTFQAVLNYLIFLPAMLLFNVTLIIAIFKTNRRQHPPRMYILIITTVCFFLFLSVPLSLTLFLHQHGVYSTEYASISLLLSCLNSSLNPVIYFLVGRCRKRQARSSVTTALKTAFLDESEASQQ